ncbi:hypothetical protein D9M72_544590 [compost metagenome]
MFDVAVQVGVKVPADADVGSERNERTERSALAQRHVVHDHCVGSLDRPGLHVIRGAAVGQHLANRTVRNGDHDVPCAGIGPHELRVTHHAMPVDLSGFELVVHKH